MKVSWYKNKTLPALGTAGNGRKRRASGRVEIKVVDSFTFTMTIMGVQMSDAGLYQVEVLSIRYTFLD
jgi:hypothetical protein